MRAINILFWLLLLSVVVVRSSYADAVEQYIEARAARACAGWGNTTNKSQGNVSVDNLSIQGDGKGTITVYRDGVDLGKFSTGTFDQYQKCLIEVIKLISPNKPVTSRDNPSRSDYRNANLILSDIGVDVKIGSTYKSNRGSRTEIINPDSGTPYHLFKEGFPDIKTPVAAVQISSGEKEAEPGKETAFDGYAFLDAKSGVVIGIYLSDAADEGYNRGGPALIESWKQKFGYDTQNFIEISRSEIKSENGWSRVIRNLRSFDIDLGSSVLWWQGRADDSIRVCKYDDRTCTPKQTEGVIWGQTIWIAKKSDDTN